MKFKQLILVIFLAGGALKCSAQATDSLKEKGKYPYEHSGGISIGVTYRKYNPGPLNDALLSAGLHNLSTNRLWYNLDLNHIYCNKVITEFGLGFSAPSSATNNDIKVTLNQGEIYYRIGYNVATSSDLRLFPFLGANFSKNFLTIKDNPAINSTNDFTQELSNNTSSKTLQETNFGLELGAGLDYLIKLKPKNSGCFQVERVLPLGIKVGRYFQTSAGDWKINSNSLPGSPDEKYSRFFVSLSIGLGYSVKK